MAGKQKKRLEKPITVDTDGKRYTTTNPDAIYVDWLKYVNGTTRDFTIAILPETRKKQAK